MEDLFDWLNDLAPDLEIVPFRHVDCPRCGAWVALVSYAGPEDTTGRARVITLLARVSTLPTFLVTVAGPDDFTVVVWRVPPLENEQIVTSAQFRAVLSQLTEHHACLA